MKSAQSLSVVIAILAISALVWWSQGPDSAETELPSANTAAEAQLHANAPQSAPPEDLESETAELLRVPENEGSTQQAASTSRELAVQVECPVEPSLMKGLAVRAWIGERQAAQALLDDQGRSRIALPVEPTPIAYSLAPLDSSIIRLELQAPLGFEVEALGGIDTELPVAQFRLNPIRRGSLTLALLDASTGEPVPEAQAVVSDRGAGVQRLISTQEGLLELNGEQEPGLFSVAVEQPGKSPFPLLNAPQSLEAVAANFDESEPLSATVTVGPTYSFHIDPQRMGSEAPELWASLIAGGENGVAPVVVWEEVPVRIKDSSNGQTAWVRMPGIAVPSSLPKPWTLVIQPQSEKSDLFGRGQVGQLVGIQDEVVSLDWADEPMGRLSGVVLDESGNPIEGALVLLFGAGANPMGKPRDLVVADLAGSFEFSPPDLDVVMITARAKGYEGNQVTVGLSSTPGPLTLELASRPIAGGVSGKISGGDSWRRLESLVMLRETTFPFHTYTATPQEDAEQQVRFEFEDVPHGDYEVWIDGLTGQSFSPERLEVAPPIAGLQFEMKPPPVLAGLDVDVGATSGAARPTRVDIQLFQNGSETRSLLQVQNPSRLGPVAVLREGATWVVGAAGFQPSLGTLASLPESGDAEKRLAIKLSTGWGRIVYVTDGEHPIPGIQFIANGETIGESDSSGWARVAAPTKPEEISLRTDGYVLPEGGLALDDQLETIGPVHQVQLELRRLF